MSRALFVALPEAAVREACAAARVEVSATERLPDGGTRLVCNSRLSADTSRPVLPVGVLSTRPDRAPAFTLGRR